VTKLENEQNGFSAVILLPLDLKFVFFLAPFDLPKVGALHYFISTFAPMEMNYTQKQVAEKYASCQQIAYPNLFRNITH
jgi:hypothetical protein